MADRHRKPANRGPGHGPATPPQGALPARGGFTVIELMLALFLAGIIAAIAIPSFRGYVDNTKLKGAARQVMTEIGDTLQRSKAENAQYRITLNADPANTYTLERITAPATTQTKNLAEFGSDIRITAASYPSNRVTFEARGILSQGGTITLQNSRSSTAVISTSQAGRSYVQFSLQ